MSNKKAVNQRIATKAIIVNSKNQVLLLREAESYDEGTNGGRYQLPGGRLEAGEPYMQGLMREIDEETGLSVEVGNPVFVGEWFPVIKGIPNQIVAIFFKCSLASDQDVRLSNEHDDYKWLSKADLNNYDVTSADTDAILTTL